MTKKLIITAIISLGLIGSMASAEDDPTSLSYISYLERYASVQPADGQDSLEAAINMPLVTGDRVDLARDARMEIVLADGNTVWLNEYSTLSLDSVAFSRDVRADRTVLFLADGNMIIELPRGIPQEHRVRVDSARHTVYLTSPGVFRVDVLPSGKLWVEVWEGIASAATPTGEVLLRAGTTAEVGESPIHAVQARMTDRDDFSRWVQSVRGQQAPTTEAIHVDTRYARQASQLNSYGNWIYVDATQSWGWQPVVSAGWSPYTSGRWYWTPTGWSWLSYEPWGWLPYHYGTWSYYEPSGWVWSWGATWSPAWVYWTSWPGYVGWCPVGAYSSWWVGVGWGWGGFYWSGGSHHGGGHHGHGGGGYDGYRPGRSPNTGRPGGLNGVGVSTRGAVSASELVLNMQGRTSASALRGRGWTAVPAGDFSSRNLSRAVRPAADFLRAGRADKIEAVISAKPLLTDSPRVRPASEGVRAAFQRVERQSSTDLSRLVARDSSLSRDQAVRLAQPTLAREVVATPQRSTAALPSRNSQTRSDRSTISATTPSRGSYLRGNVASSSERSSRESLPNAYRSNISRTSPGQSPVDRSLQSIRSRSDRPSPPVSRTPAVGRENSSSSSRDSNARSPSLSQSSSSLRSRSLSPSTSSSRSTISSSPAGSSSSIASPGRSHAPTVIPGTSYSGRTSSSRSYRTSPSTSTTGGSTASSYRSVSPSRSYTRSTPSSTSQSFSRPAPRSSSSSISGTARSTTSPYRSVSPSRSYTRSIPSTSSSRSNSPSHSSSSSYRSSSSHRSSPVSRSSTQAAPRSSSSSRSSSSISSSRSSASSASSSRSSSSARRGRSR